MQIDSSTTGLIETRGVMRPRPRPRAWSGWVSAVLFALVVACFALPFASTSCTLPGGYGRGAAGTSTVYRGVDLVLGTVPEVRPADGPTRPGAGPDGGSLGVQPLSALALLAAASGVALGLLLRRRRAVRLAAWAALTAGLLVLQQAVLVGVIVGRIEGELSQQLPSGKTAHDYVNTGPGFTAAAALLALTLLLNVVLAAAPRLRGRTTGRRTQTPAVD